MTPAAGNPDRIESLGEKMTKWQNTSYAVMAQRIEAQDSLDDFPTPPWARALKEHILEFFMQQGFSYFDIPRK
jgi:hypothetical protein